MWAVAVVAAVAVCALLSVPYLASTQIVRDRIAQQLSAWSGYRVELGSAPVVDIWPVFGAVLNDVTFSQWSAGSEPVVSADRVEIDLSAFAALRGDVVFSKIRLVRPTIRLVQGKTLPMPSPPLGGRLVRSIDQARSASEDVSTPTQNSVLPADSFGIIEFSDGRLIEPTGNGHEDVVTSLSGRLDWPALNRAATLTANGIWRGEPVTVEAQTAQPLLLLAGRNVRTRISIKSAPATIQFDGSGSLAAKGFVDGKIDISTPSVRRMLEWSRAEVAPDAPIGSVTIAGVVTGDVQRLKFSDVRLTLDGNPGMGAIEMSYDGDIPGIAGTLAFDTLDLQSFLAAFTSISKTSGSVYNAIDASIAERINLDLRLSASSAKAGAFSLTDVAATAQVKGGLAAFDISDATAFGGILQAGIRIDRSETGGDVEIRFIATGIDTGAFARTIGLDNIVPQARGDISVILKGDGQTWSSVFENSNGSISASFGPGSIGGLDLKALREKSGDVGFFPMSDIAAGSMAIRSAELKASVAKGVARIEKAEARTTDTTILFTGIVPYVGRGLALTGTVAPTGENNAAPGASFFVGGTWGAPYIYTIQPGAPPG